MAQGFRLLQGQAMLHMGRALAAQGQTASGLAQMQEGLAITEATGGHSYYMVLTMLLVAEAYALNGQAEVGLEVLAAALDFVNTRGLRLWEAEVHRLRGELLLAHHGPRQTPPARREEEAVACFERALELARQGQARAWELRAGRVESPR